MDDEYKLLRVGDRVSTKYGDATVEAITLAENYMLDGVDVPAVHWVHLKNHLVVISLDNKHWCYGDQVYGPAEPVKDSSIDSQHYQ
jgi:hypothetical protein